MANVAVLELGHGAANLPDAVEDSAMDGRLEQPVEAQLTRLAGSSEINESSENEGEGHLAP